MDHMKKLILASASPRRHELLKQIGLRFEVIIKPVDETLDEHLSPQDAVCELAYRKAREAASAEDNAIVIGADTVVVNNGIILGKPLDCEDAVNALRSLSGSTHVVITGFSVLDTATNKVIKDSETSEVVFRELTEQEILSYVSSGEPMDKAGSYGIQGLGAIFVERINGCYFNIVGLPLTKVALALKDFGIDVWS